MAIFEAVRALQVNPLANEMTPKPATHSRQWGIGWWNWEWNWAQHKQHHYSHYATKAHSSEPSSLEESSIYEEQHWPRYVLFETQIWVAWIACKSFGCWSQLAQNARDTGNCIQTRSKDRNGHTGHLIPSMWNHEVWVVITGQIIVRVVKGIHSLIHATAQGIILHKRLCVCVSDPCLGRAFFGTFKDWREKTLYLQEQLTTSAIEFIYNSRSHSLIPG